MDCFLKSLLNLLQYCFCFTFWVFDCEECGILALPLGIEPTPLALEGEVPTTELPGKSLRYFYKNALIESIDVLRCVCVLVVEESVESEMKDKQAHSNNPHHLK